MRGTGSHPVGDGDGLGRSGRRAHHQRVTTLVPEDESVSRVTAEVTVTSPDLGTRALLQSVVVTNPATGTVVAGARNASDRLPAVDRRGWGQPAPAGPW